jgi:hypothetical protein
MGKRLSIKIDLTKIDKSKIFEGKTGKYIDCTVWINDEPDKYGNIGSVKQEWKEGSDYKGVYIGNVKSPKTATQPQAPQTDSVQDDDDMPF